ncbi:MAG: diguanylate cyclase [Acidimicrobiales bacterium]|nr:diguanylate cyclase [Acidimicrobiales bacterium]
MSNNPDIFELILESVPEGVMLLNGQGVVTIANRAAYTLLGSTRESVYGHNYRDLIKSFVEQGGEVKDEDGGLVKLEDHPILKTLSDGKTRTDVLLGLTLPGAEPIWLRVNTSSLRQNREGLPANLDEAGHQVVVSMRNVTWQHQSQEKLARALEDLAAEREFLRVLLDNLQEGIIAVDEHGHFTVFNPASARFHGISDTSKLIGKVPTGSDLELPDGTRLSPKENPLLRALEGEHIRNESLIIDHPPHPKREILATAQSLHDSNGNLIGAVVAMHDVTEQKRVERELADLAMRDPLTGVANRLKFDDELADAVSESEVNGTTLAVFMVDLDGFKAINDSYGHQVGDEVLRHVARRLRQATRPKDTVARIGGDEFVVICALDTPHIEVKTLYGRLESSLKDSIATEEGVVHIRASLGYALREPHSKVTALDLLRGADNQMYKQKAAKKEISE